MGSTDAAGLRQYRALAWTLTDLKNDFAEQNDLVARQPKLLDELIEQWEKIDAQMVQAAW